MYKGRTYGIFQKTSKGNYRDNMFHVFGVDVWFDVTSTTCKIV